MFTLGISNELPIFLSLKTKTKTLPHWRKREKKKFIHTGNDKQRPFTIYTSTTRKKEHFLSAFIAFVATFNFSAPLLPVPSLLSLSLLQLMTFFPLLLRLFFLSLDRRGSQHDRQVTSPPRDKTSTLHCSPSRSLARLCFAVLCMSVCVCVCACDCVCVCANDSTGLG